MEALVLKSNDINIEEVSVHATMARGRIPAGGGENLETLKLVAHVTCKIRMKRKLRSLSARWKDVVWWGAVNGVMRVLRVAAGWTLLFLLIKLYKILKGTKYLTHKLFKKLVLLEFFTLKKNYIIEFPIDPLR